MRLSARAVDDLIADPFAEHASGVRTRRLHVLGGRFQFESDNARLLQIAHSAYGDLPRHKLAATTPEFQVRLLLRAGGRAQASGEPSSVQMMSGAGLLFGTSGASSVILSPAERAGLVVVAGEMLRFPYHTRYELIEFAVCTLAARVQGLVPLHAACVGRGGRGFLIIGPSGAGKSTLALHALLAGFDFLGEDSVFVSPDSLLATGVANFLHVREDSLRFVQRRRDADMIRRSPVIRRRSGVEKFELDLRRGGYRLAARPLKIAAVVVLSSAHAEAGSLLRPIGRSRLVSELRASQPYARHQPGWRAFTVAASALPAFELFRGRHPDDSVEALRTL
jgi:hypothetical protein